MRHPFTPPIPQCSPWPPALQFTPEVASGIDYAADQTFGQGWSADPAEEDLDLLAQVILDQSPELARFLLGLKLAEA